MIFAKVTATDFGILSIVLIVVIVLGYRLLRRDSLIRLTRVGVFFERERFDEPEEEPEEPEAETKVLWPKQEER